MTGLLVRRLLERRLLGDGDAGGSVIPGAVTTLSLSFVLFALVIPERTPAEVALLLATACLVWSGLRAFLESHDLDAAVLDRAVLEPLPIPARTLALARGVVIATALAISSLNLALPPVVMMGVVAGPRAGAGLLFAALAASLCGLALAQVLRLLLERTLGAARLAELEGPIRLISGVALFGLLFAAPDPAPLLAKAPWLAQLPPFSLAAAGTSALPAAAAVLVALGLLFLSFRFASADASQRSRRVRPASGPLRRLCRLLVRPDERAAYDFTLANIARDRSFRTRVYPLFAFPFAVVLLVVGRPEDPFLTVLALYGAAIYLTLAQTFLAYSESEGGPRLLRALPIPDAGAFRAGAEKAFLVALLVPVYGVLTVALAVTGLFGRGFGVQGALAHAAVAAAFAAVVCAITFERETALAFSIPDENAYPRDLNGPFLALLLAAAGALLATVTVPVLPWFAIELVLLALLLRASFAWKRRRTAGARPLAGGE